MPRDPKDPRAPRPAAAHEAFASAWSRAIYTSLVLEAGARGLDNHDELFRRVSSIPKARDPEKLRQLLSGDPPLALIRFDTPGIQRYLFRVMRPVDIEGGSHLVEGFVSPDAGTGPGVPILERRLGLGSDHFVYTGGGGGLLLGAASQAPEVERLLEAELAEKTHGELTTVAASVAVWPWELSAGDLPLPTSDRDRAPDLRALEGVLGPLRRTSPYGRTLAALGLRLQARRARRVPSRPRLPGGRVHQRCQACARRLAERVLEELRQPVLLCPGCHVRRTEGVKKKQELRLGRSYEILVEGLGDPGIALIYADGANVGAAFERLESPIQHALLSRAVSRAMDAARQAAIDTAESLAPWLETPYLRWQAPLRGGDDLLLILPAGLAPDVIVPMAHAYEACFDFGPDFPGCDSPGAAGLRTGFGSGSPLREVAGRFGLGIGFTVADWVFPVQFTLEYAKALLASAKQRIRSETTSRTRSAVDFLVLRNATPLSTDLEALRSEHFELRDPADPSAHGARLTRRPYSLEDFQKLLTDATHLAQVPSSQRHALSRELRRGRAVSQNLWRYQHARAEKGSGDAETGAGWRAYRQARCASLSEVDSLLWTSDPMPDGTRADATSFLDALDLVHLRERREAIDRTWSRFVPASTRGATA